VVKSQDKIYFENSPKGLLWKTNNQVYKNIPYGHQIDEKTKKPYHVSKYYIASPPVFTEDKKDKANTLYDIGIVTPDEFTFKGDKPVQQLYLDYDILKSMKIKYLSVTFDKSFDELGISLVPINIECKDFPWLDKKSYKDAKGASGIGYLDKNGANTPKELILPYYKKDGEKNNTYLNCEVTILNDILFHHEIFFMVNGKKQQTINLKDFYEQNKNNSNAKIVLHCEYKEELPCGCTEELPKP